MSRRQHYIKIPLSAGRPDLFYTVPVIRGRHTIELTRNEQDVLTAARGDVLACMNANCVSRSAALGKFPHPVLLTMFQKSSVYIVDKVDKGGVPTRAVWYKHNDPRGVGVHDKLGPKEILKRGMADKLVLLMPPRKSRYNQDDTGRSHARHAKGSRALPPVSPGALRRAQAAGIMLPPSLVKDLTPGAIAN